MKSVSSPAERTLSAKVLLVDGNQHGLTARGMILREQGYTVETVSSG
jgi:CheY-like chemotaxis protein